MNAKNIDLNFNFTTDTPNYWDNYWDNIYGKSLHDPDAESKTLQKYHQILWSKQLPNGDFLNLIIGRGSNYLTWNDFRFGSDSIIASFRYKKNKKLMDKVVNELPNYREFMQNYIDKSYTIAGSIIFPKKQGGINQSRGCNPHIVDRWDLTLECIRRYYANEESPLSLVLKQNKDFFDLFVNFKGYVDFFYLQDCVSADYKSVIMWLPSGLGEKHPFPKTVEEYVLWIKNQLEFVEKRKDRIKASLKQLD